MVEYRLAKITDTDEILTLHQRYQVDSISEQDKPDGFITTAFTQKQLVDLINQEQGVFVAIQGRKIIGYAMSASWQYWSNWPIFAYMMENLTSFEYKGIRLSATNSYQYGPICVDKAVRGTGVFESLFEFALAQMSTRYRVLVTYVNKSNMRSYQAHTRKVDLDQLTEFEFNQNNYHQLVCLTAEYQPVT